MVERDEQTEGSDQGVPIPAKTPASTVRGKLWGALSKAWDRARNLKSLSRFALHFGFFPVVLTGLLVGRAVISSGESCAVLCPTTQEYAAASSLDMASLGTGGELADVLFSAVVPHTTIPRRYRIDPITYTVGSGDSVSSIADKYGVSMETVLWANGNLEDNPDYLADGDVLTILPVSGVYHAVVAGDTLASVAKQYNAKVEDIARYEGNYMQEPYSIKVGQKLIVPGGRKPYQVRHVVAWSGTVPAGAKKGTGSFGYPISGFISQRYSEYHRALDIAAPRGTKVKAADSGYVALVGRNDTSYGRYVVIDHGNGFQTLYGHFDTVYVEAGQSVGKGQVIGLCGSTGKSTGPHVHFEIILNGVKRNPAIYLK